MLFRLLLQGLLLVSVPVLRSQDTNAQPVPSQQPETPQPQSDQRQRIHSQQVHGGIPGQITQQLAQTSGDVHLRNTQAPPLTIQLDPLSTLENMTCENDLVVLGNLKDGTSHPTVDQGYIYTDWDLTITEILKNNSKSQLQVGQTIVVTRPGGTIEVGGRRVHAATDAPQFQPGNEVLLYLHYLPDAGTYSLSSPSGFVFSGQTRIDLDRSRFGQFRNMQKTDLLDLARKAAMARGSDKV